MLRLIENQGTTEALKELGTLDEIARAGAYRMLMMALHTEIAAYVERHQDAVDADGRQLVVRNGKAKARSVTCGAGTLEVRAPRVNDRRCDADGKRQRFTRQIAAVHAPFAEWPRCCRCCICAGCPRATFSPRWRRYSVKMPPVCQRPTSRG